MSDEQLRIPQDNEYFHAVGMAAVAFARLEWNAVWCCERLEAGYINTIETNKKTAGTIGRDLRTMFSRVSDGVLRSRIEPLAADFSAIVEDRNGLLHGKPGTALNGDQRLFRHGFEWTVGAINDFSDWCAKVSLPLNNLLYAEFKEPCAVALDPK